MTTGLLHSTTYVSEYFPTSFLSTESRGLKDPLLPNEQVHRAVDHCIYSFVDMTEEEVVAEAVQIILAGFETTASTLRFMLYSLVSNPAQQQQVYDEMQRVIGEVRWQIEVNGLFCASSFVQGL